MSQLSFVGGTDCRSPRGEELELSGVSEESIVTSDFGNG